MRCLKCFRKHQGRTLVFHRRHHNQVLQHWIFLVDDHDELLQIRNRDLKAPDAPDAITLPKSKDYFLFIFCSDDPIFVRVIDDERERR
jgi:hypothetical protein